LIHTLRSLCNAFTNSWASMSASFMLSPKPSDPVKGQFYITERNGRVRGPRPVKADIPDGERDVRFVPIADIQSVADVN